MKSKRRVVVTGIGMVSPLGLDLKQTWTNLLQGKSGISHIEYSEEKVLCSQIAGVVKNFQFNLLKIRNLSKMDLFVQYGLKAAQEAIEDACLENLPVEEKKRVGVSIGSGLGGFTSFEKQHKKLLKAYNLNQSTLRSISPFFVPGTIINMISGLCAIEYGFQGANFSVVSACATGAHNIGLGARSIAYGDAEMMVVGAAEVGSALLSMAGFSACKALSKNYDHPETASRPWDQKRDGFVLADGAAVLILEEYEYAIKRGIKIYGEVLGFGMSADAYNIIAPEPNGQGLTMAMQNALSDANLKPQKVDYINAHATSTLLGDAAETKAIAAVLGDHVKQVKISSTKSMTGHLLGAAGALEAAFCLLAIQEKVAPPTINLEVIDAHCKHMNLVPHHAQPGSIQVALSNSSGFGGTNASLLFKKL